MLSASARSNVFTRAMLALFAQAGIAVPHDLKDAWTWSQLRDIGLKLTDRSGGTTTRWGFGSQRDIGDWVVLPYRRAWSSGVLARAHALGTPSIVSGVGGLAEQADEHDMVALDDAELDRAFAGPVRPIAGAQGPETRTGEQRHHRHGGGAGPETDWDPELESVMGTRKGRTLLIAFILVSVGLAAVAQLTLKHGMNQVTQHGEIPLDLGRPVDVLRRIALNASVWAGLAAFELSAAVWLIVLSRASLSFAYPFASLTYVLILVFDRFVLNEPISGLRYGGVALIIAGLLLISRTHQTA